MTFPFCWNGLTTPTAKHGKGILMLDALTKRGYATAYSEWLAAIVQNIKPCEAAANR
jgi:hypothetical protein